jgi:hypothetical protein
VVRINIRVRGVVVQFLLPAVQAKVTLTTERTERWRGLHYSKGPSAGSTHCKKSLQLSPFVSRDASVSVQLKFELNTIDKNGYFQVK